MHGRAVVDAMPAEGGIFDYGRSDTPSLGTRKLMRVLAILRHGRQRLDRAVDADHLADGRRANVKNGTTGSRRAARTSHDRLIELGRIRSKQVFVSFKADPIRFPAVSE
jgi:hypothetical protein